MPGLIIFGGGGIADGITAICGGKSITKDDCDVRNPSDVLKTIQIFRPNIVVNCAGVSNPQMIKDSNPDDWMDEIFTNLYGSYLVSKFAFENGVDQVIHIASVAGKYGKPNHSGYSASKCGVISLVQSLGMEGLKAYAISPGRVDTPMRQKDYPNDLPNTRLEPEEIGNVVKDIIDNKYTPGDNIIIRRIGFETAPIKVDKGEPWKNELKVGQPVTL